MTSEILSEKRGAALIVSFNRPNHGNALTLDMANQLFNVLKPATTDRAIRAVLLKGMGENFMSGIDMNNYAGDFTAALERVNQMFQPYNAAVREMQGMDKPVLAVVEGIAAGVGLGFMLACDLVVAARSAKFNGKFASYAMTPHGGSSFMLPRKIGLTKALEIFMLGEDFGAAEAERWNLINRVIDDDKLQEESLVWLDRLAGGPTRAYSGIKKLTMKAFEQDLNIHLGLEHTYWGASTRTFDFREAVKAHFAKRPAKFTGT
jgi:2-(1,2-epoxy-1,2-dihydrophenyl)acetyl-CoA isomerase